MGLPVVSTLLATPVTFRSSVYLLEAVRAQPLVFTRFRVYARLFCYKALREGASLAFMYKATASDKAAVTNMPMYGVW